MSSEEQSGAANDRLFCREQALEPGSPFRVSRAFAARELADGLVALYALYSVIDQACTDSADPDVALSKLNWWRTELRPGHLASSRHPVVRELLRAGLDGGAAGGDIGNLLDGVEWRLDGPAPAGMDELADRCRALARPRFRLEAGLCGRRDGVDFQPGAEARSGLFQLLGESLRSRGQGAFRWLPMNLLARHGVSRHEFSGGLDTVPAVALFADLMDGAAAWGAGPPVRRGGGSNTAMAHLFAISGLCDRKLNRMKMLSPARYGEEIARSGLAELFTAWRGARAATR